MAICQQPYTYVDLASGSLHIALGGGKAGPLQTQISRAFAKRSTAALAALHGCWVFCVLCLFTQQMRHAKRGVHGLYGTAPRQLQNWNWKTQSSTAR